MTTDERARRGLVRLLQDAHAGELAAAHAYRGHWRSLRRHPVERAEVQRIEGAEWHHRDLVATLLRELGAAPRRRREALMWTIGRFFGDCIRGHWLLRPTRFVLRWSPPEPLAVAVPDAA